MSNGEFDIIQRYFTASKRLQRKDVIVSIGDDCAITEHYQNQRIAITTDTMVENTHFLPSIKPADLAYKAAATNLSDLAAMGATPAWFSLAITLPHVDEQWLSEFSQSLFDVLDHYNVALIGGDTTKGPVYTITITAQGIVPKGKALCRHSAQDGDWIYVSGTLGDSAAGLALLLQNAEQEQMGAQSAVTFEQEYLIQRHLRPTPRVLLGLELASAELANAAIDISDGFIADLGHILQRSQCGAVIDLDKLPLSEQLIETVGLAQAEKFALTGGEDYELCFTVPDRNREKLERALAHIGVNYSCVGQIRHKQRISFQRNGKPVELDSLQGFDHFK
ncbi:thiamine-phosphate kinase [Canicola haemoglobinophilus]|uniref:Thiamine-monophosphate kinase n=1 Tax=Canicola haemoglobinophilus TaxID=733 RepID=A0A1V4B3Y5_9PAST|nr:thiamine-phosphate kinase [Canicola haemoglobinophilus]OOS02058.1 thiamine-phosphate kinase [Canicola haemoglobinophilus]STO54047.1 thiamine-monophosphate kinase [Canicola haemoglobinophilus]STO60516.1 thiamine-monophosphate kinase [Canicola haemoglobinophilus]STO68580.1 thiamine-monophosphate kinase [Canicola haemoglobinophilus]